MRLLPLTLSDTAELVAKVSMWFAVTAISWLVMMFLWHLLQDWLRLRSRPEPTVEPYKFEPYEPEPQPFVWYRFEPLPSITAYQVSLIIRDFAGPVPGLPLVKWVRLRPPQQVRPEYAEHFVELPHTSEWGPLG